MEDSKKPIRALTTIIPPFLWRQPIRALHLGVLSTSLLGAAALLYPAYAAAQSGDVPTGALSPEYGLVVTPYVSLETLYDSNIFPATGLSESDTILRLSPGIGLGYRSKRSTFNLFYTFDAERYSKYSELNSWQTRQVGQIGGTYDFTDRFTGGLSANYLESYYPGELTPVTAVELTRTRATRVSIHPTLSYQFNPRTSAAFFYDRAREHIATGLTTYITTASASVTRELTRRDQLMLQYQAVWYDFSTGTSPISRLANIGWTHAFSRETSLSLTAGPRNTDGRNVADINAGIRHDSGRATQSLFYTRSQVTLVGQGGVYDTDSWVARFGFRPSPRWAINFEPGYYRVYQGAREAKVYRFGIQGRYWFARDWSVSLNYLYTHQRGVLGLAGNNPLILRNVLSLSLTWALPTGPGHAVLPTRQGYALPSSGNGR